MTIRAMEFCCCAGGMALGFRRAGIEFELAVDYDADACSSYEHNLGHRPLQMDLRDFLRMLKTYGVARAPNLIVADPPCQPWSAAGRKAGLDDERDCLRPMVEIVKLLKPDAFLLANVPGLEHGNAAEALTETIGSLSYEGYCVDEMTFDAADYGVPQHRIRPFFFVHRGSTCITWPSATHTQPSGPQAVLCGIDLPPWVTCRQALHDLPPSDLGKVRNVRPTDKAGPAVLPWPWDRPSTTVCAENWIAQPGHTNGGKGDLSDGKPYQGWKAVVLPERARARLQGFPDRVCGCNGGFPLAEIAARQQAAEDGELDAARVCISEVCQECWLPWRPWKFAGATQRARSVQIGLAMPPPLAEAVARSIAAWFADRATYSIPSQLAAQETT